MLSALESLAGDRGRRLLLAAVAIASAGLFAVPTAGAAVPALGITMTHLNAYGSQCGGEKGTELKKAEEEKCVDPFTGSPKTFAQESGENRYFITVANEHRGSKGGRNRSHGGRPPPGRHDRRRFQCARLL